MSVLILPDETGPFPAVAQVVIDGLTVIRPRPTNATPTGASSCCGGFRRSCARYGADIRGSTPHNLIRRGLPLANCASPAEPVALGSRGSSFGLNWRRFRFHLSDWAVASWPIEFVLRAFLLDLPTRFQWFVCAQVHLDDVWHDFRQAAREPKRVGPSHVQICDVCRVPANRHLG